MHYESFFKQVTGTGERGRFEAFVAKTHPGLYVTRTDYRGRESYSNEQVRLMWSAWQYRAELKPIKPLRSSETNEDFS